MCFNKEVSLLVFLFSFITSMSLYDKEPNTATFILVLSLIQLVEFFLWKNQKKDSNNLFWSKMIVITLFLQLAIYFSTNVTIGNLYEKQGIEYLTITIISLVILTILTILMLFKTPKYSLKNNKTCRLVWGYFSNNILTTIYSIVYPLLLSLLVYNNFGFKGLCILIGTLLVTYSYSMITNSMYSFGSLWCFLSVLLVIIFGILNVVLEEKINHVSDKK
jgi:hypothetical protein